MLCQSPYPLHILCNISHEDISIGKQSLPRSIYPTWYPMRLTEKTAFVGTISLAVSQLINYLPRYTATRKQPEPVLPPRRRISFETAHSPAFSASHGPETRIVDIAGRRSQTNARRHHRSNPTSGPPTRSPLTPSIPRWCSGKRPWLC